MSGRRHLPVVEVKGVPVHALTERQTVDFIMEELGAGRGGWVVTHNLDHLRRRVGDAEFSRLCASADLVVADGMPLVWASRLRRRPLPERVAGSNLVSSLAAAAASAGRSLYLLGGAPGTALAAASVLAERHPGLRLAGTCCPEPGFEQDAGRLEEIGNELAMAEPDLVLVALGSPKQERLIERLRRRLPRAWWLGVGISFSFLSGDVIRAPAWMQRAGFEWFHRLLQEPRRLGRRYLVQGVPFALRLLASSAWEGVTGRGSSAR